MIRTGILGWPGGEHDFALPLGQLRALQEHTGAGPQEVFRRLTDGSWRVDDLVEVIRLGLIGAGSMDQAEAGPEVTRLFGLHPLASFVPVARVIMGARLFSTEAQDFGQLWPRELAEFALPLGQIRALQENVGAGPQAIFRRVSDGTWLVDDLVEIVRLGLIGARTLSQSEAGPEVTRLFEDLPLLPIVPVAQAILGVALVGPEDDPVGKLEGTTRPSPENGSSPSSTETAP